MMNTYVNIGSSQDFRLSRALLIYGTSNYDSFPYRHPFVTLHEIVHDNDGSRLAEGQLATPQMLIRLLTELGVSVPVEILPERVLVRTPDVIAWWTPACERTMFFSDHGADDTLRKLNGGRYPQPPLVFKACGTQLWVRAMRDNKRPTGTTGLCIAPYWNCYENGNVCTGSMRIPRKQSVDALASWEESFFQSEFTHGVGNAKRTEFSGGLLAMWETLRGEKDFPSQYLADARESLAAFVKSHEHKTTNRA